MKKPSYIGKQRDELMRNLNESRTVLRDFRFAASGSKARNIKEGRAARKNIARIMTELNKNK